MKPVLNFRGGIQKLRPCLAALKEVVSAVEKAPKIEAFYILSCECPEAEAETYHLALQMGAHRYPIWVGGHSLAIAAADKHMDFVRRWLSRSDETYLDNPKVVVLDSAKLFPINIATRKIHDE